jgi:hypothetical protein
MNLLQSPAKFSGRRSFVRLTHSCWYTTTRQAQQVLLKRIYRSPSACGCADSSNQFPGSPHDHRPGFLQFPGNRTFVSTCKNQIGEWTDRPFPHCRTHGWPRNLLNKVPYRCVCGGCLPRCASSSRIAKASGRFMCSAMTVARPVGVIPTTRTPSQRKCRGHASRRGSNNMTSAGQP